MKTKEEILKAETAKEVLAWIKENSGLFDRDVGEFFNKLVREEFEAGIPNYDPHTHYDVF